MPEKNSFELPDGVFKAERDEIDRRRALNDRPKVKLINQPADGQAGEPAGNFDLSGLALSGGGIRSAAFCLGAVQALHQYGIFQSLDYMSTVSGGGYTGAAITASLSEKQPDTASTPKDDFPFASDTNDMSDSAQMGHLRDYSNYLIPRGKSDLIKDIVVVLRGLAANVLLVLPVLLAVAAASILLLPYYVSLELPLSAYAAGLNLIILCLWSVSKSKGKVISDIGFRSTAGTAIAIAAVLVLAAAVVIDLHFALVLFPINWTWPAIAGVVSLPAAGSLLAFFIRQISNLLASGVQKKGVGGVVRKLAARLFMLLVALAVPVLIWLFTAVLVRWSVTSGGTVWVSDDREIAIWAIYLAIAILLMIPALTLKPNANSLHRLYRDRLADAFLHRRTGKQGRNALKSVDLKLSAIDTARTPYHLIGAALNIQGDPGANARARNADFFLFSKCFCGSQMAGYKKTTDFEHHDGQLTLASAMAISGAAVSSNMGSQSIRYMAPTLALLNLRLGYWLANPDKTKNWLLNRLYLVSEIISALKPSGPWFYLTDGGHIDNLGLYELLRRRCAFIMVIDAEADPGMRFHAFAKVQAYARIDLGVRITMRWDKLAAGRPEGAAPAAGPHCLVGDIEYSRGGKGKLVYVKAALTGDENAYVRDYALRNPDFPHETTGDQFFSEEQFEAYRALGFHSINGLYKRPSCDRVELSVPGVDVNGTTLVDACQPDLRPPSGPARNC